MSTRISDRAWCAAAWPAIALAACSPQGSGQGSGQDDARRSDAAPSASPGLTIGCAHGDADFANACSVDRQATVRGTVLTVRHPDGHFRRLLVTGDGRGVSAADGAETASVALAGGGIEVRVGDDRYRLPATVKAAAHP